MSNSLHFSNSVSSPPTVITTFRHQVLDAVTLTTKAREGKIWLAGEMQSVHNYHLQSLQACKDQIGVIDTSTEFGLGFKCLLIHRLHIQELKINECFEKFSPYIALKSLPKLTLHNPLLSWNKHNVSLEHIQDYCLSGALE